MKYKTPVVVFCIIISVSFLSAGATNLNLIDSNKEINLFSRGDTTLITEYELGIVMIIDHSENIIWEKTGLNHPYDAERLSTGNILITEQGNGQVLEVDLSGFIVWQKTDLSDPVDAERLSNGNTLITERGGNKVIEVDSSGAIVWQKTDLSDPVDAERLSNGNTLITEYDGNSILEVDNDGAIVWQKLGLRNPYDTEILSNGNILITEYSGGRVLEINSSGSIIWQKTGLYSPCDAERLDSGNTLIIEAGPDRVIEIDSDGDIVWQCVWLDRPVDVERIIVISDPPTVPTIEGPTVVQMNKKAFYEFTSTDPNGDEIEYFVDWGDGYSEWSTPHSSGDTVRMDHTWREEGTFTIKAKAVDPFGEESDWSSYDITVEKGKFVVKNIFSNTLVNYLRIFLKSLNL